MPILISKHALKRMGERGATQEEVEETIELGYQQTKPNNHSVFHQGFDYCREWVGVYYRMKHLTVHAVYESPDWIVKTVIVKWSE